MAIQFGQMFKFEKGTDSKYIQKFQVHDGSKTDEIHIHVSYNLPLGLLASQHYAMSKI
jgi:hypothetical protein